MKSSAKKILPVILGINHFLSLYLLGETPTFSSGEQAVSPGSDTNSLVLNPPLGSSDEEQIAIQEMTQKLQSITTPVVDKVGKELLGANVRADSKEPTMFQSKVKIELISVQYEPNRSSGSMTKWTQVKIKLRAITDDKSIKWTDNCRIKLYLGYNDCRTDGKMLLFETECTCATFPIHMDQTILFFIPGDICQRYNLSQIPDYCAIRITVDGIGQSTIIVNKEGKDTHRSDADAHHRMLKERAYIEDKIVRNVDQLPNYVKTEILQHPTLRLEVDA
jgi:hypothetical protein